MMNGECLFGIITVFSAERVCFHGSRYLPEFQ